MSITKLESQVSDYMRSSVIVSSLKDCVMELVLNSIEAKAKNIQISVLGPFEVEITDDGHGMDPLEMKNLIGTRNNTSKCQNAINFGHRGEALASIIQVAHVKISSKRYHQAFQIKFHNKKVSEFTTVYLTRKGTCIHISDLFYNLPVRKNIQNDGIQSLKRSLEILALAFPTISIQCKDVEIKLVHTKESQSSLETFLQLFDPSFPLTPIRFEKEDIRIHGFYGMQGHISKYHQYIYVNQHYLESSDLYSIFNTCFSSKISSSKSISHTIYAVFIECDPSFTHLVKTSVYTYTAEFSKSAQEILYQLIELKSNKPIQLNRPVTKKFKVTKERESTMNWFQNPTLLNSGFGIATSLSWAEDALIKWKNPVLQNNGKQVQKASNHLCLTNACCISRQELQELEFIGQLDDKFLLCKKRECRDLIVIDQHAADERIKLEAILTHLKHHEIALYTLDPPLALNLSDRHIVALKKRLDELKAWGLEFNASLDLFRAPTLFQSRIETYPRAFKDIIMTHLQELEENRPNSLLPSGYIQLTNSMACRSAVKFGTILSRNECIEILKNLKNCRFPFQCAHGRPCMIPLIKV